MINIKDESDVQIWCDYQEETRQTSADFFLRLRFANFRTFVVSAIDYVDNYKYSSGYANGFGNGFGDGNNYGNGFGNGFGYGFGYDNGYGRSTGCDGNGFDNDNHHD